MVSPEKNTYIISDLKPRGKGTKWILRWTWRHKSRRNRWRRLWGSTDTARLATSQWWPSSISYSGSWPSLNSWDLLRSTSTEDSGDDHIDDKYLLNSSNIYPNKLVSQQMNVFIFPISFFTVRVILTKYYKKCRREEVKSPDFWKSWYL